MSSPFRVALTFDAEHPNRPNCPPDAPDRILDSLKETETRATFFVQGAWAQAYPEKSRRIVSDGHLVGHHSNYHVRMPLLRDEGLREDVRRGADHIAAACGVDPRPWFRCPFGAGAEDPRVLGVLTELGYRDVGWHVELQDWEPWRAGRDISEDTVREATAYGDGAVVLLHTWPGGTADAVPGIVADLIAGGATFVGIDELEGLP